MKFTVEVGLTKASGSRQEEDSIRDALDEAIEGIGSIFAQDAEHDEDSEYEITSVQVFPLAAG